MKVTSRIKARKIFSYTMVIPAAIFLCMIVIIPIMYSFGVSLTDLSFRTADSLGLIGLANYWEVLHSGLFWNALGLTLVFVAGTVS